MKVSDSSIQQIMAQRPDLIDRTQYHTENLIQTVEGLIQQKITTDVETVVGTVINESIGSIIDIYV